MHLSYKVLWYYDIFIDAISLLTFFPHVASLLSSLYSWSLPISSQILTFLFSYKLLVTYTCMVVILSLVYMITLMTARSFYFFPNDIISSSLWLNKILLGLEERKEEWPESWWDVGIEGQREEGSKTQVSFSDRHCSWFSWLSTVVDWCACISEEWWLGFL